MDNSSNCSCQQTPTCVVSSSIFYDVLYAAERVIRFTVPGIMRRCYIVEGLLQSTLTCFYNQLCINDIRHALNTTLPLDTIIKLNTTALNPLLSSKFQINSTLNDIINQLMADEWLTISLHDKYYVACNPDTCTYSIVDKNDFISVISTIIGILESPTTILRFVVPKAGLAFDDRPRFLFSPIGVVFAVARGLQYFNRILIATTIKIARTFLSTKTISELTEDFNEINTPLFHTNDEKKLLEWIQQNIKSDDHTSSTCTMGNKFQDDKMIVVDRRLRVRHTKKLRIADASIIPNLISGNPNQITMIIGLKAADMILEDNS
ncbi:unnamed protein product [Adineta steineri]|uniref:Glucose-methanol-choline oxidoreductase C-terminal domain-containing protein n=1 Tax=Adineta steineri TaxID=433720 RepID=A0A814BPM3_9BILA|nr:unnamed protein product [Adineta steineri]